MNLQECLDVLARGKLSNLSLVSKGKVIEEAIPEVVDAINEGLRRIYTLKKTMSSLNLQNQEQTMRLLQSIL